MRYMKKRNPDIQSGVITDDMALLVSERTELVSLALFDCGGFKRAVDEAMVPRDIVHNYDEFMIGFIAGTTGRSNLFVEEQQPERSWDYLTGDEKREGELVSVVVDIVEVFASVARVGYGRLMYELLMSWAQRFEGIMPERGEEMDAGTKAIWDALEKDKAVTVEPWGDRPYEKLYRRDKPLKEFYPLQVRATVTLLSAARKFPGSLMDLQRLFFVAGDEMMIHGITES